MFGFFRKKTSDTRDLEQLIFDIAEHQRDSDFELLYLHLRGRELHVPIDTSTLPAHIPPGQAYQTTSSDRIMMRSSNLPDGRPIAMAATHLEAAMLASGHVDMQWEDLLGMVLKLPPEYFGFVLQGKTSWIVFDRQRTAYILSRVKA
ncbi:MAG: hypothetical protein JNM58_12945 [Xanthomonadaceae bacterium]|nr:hypothetical protein [Xanthomonadaceae bacterium]